MDLFKNDFELEQNKNSQVSFKNIFFFVIILILAFLLAIAISFLKLPYEERINELLFSILYTVFGIGMVVLGYSDAIGNNIVKVNFIPMPSSIYGGFKVLLGMSLLIHTFLYLQFIGLITVPIGFVFLYIILIRKNSL